MQVIGLLICRTMDWYINLYNILNSYLKNKRCGHATASFIYGHK